MRDLPAVGARVVLRETADYFPAVGTLGTVTDITSTGLADPIVTVRWDSPHDPPLQTVAVRRLELLP